MSKKEEGEKVKIIKCESQPAFVGKIGEVIKETRNFTIVKFEGLEGKRYFYHWEVERLSQVTNRGSSPDS